VLAALAKEPELTRDVLLEALRPRLPAYMMPAHVELRTQPLPRNANGKIDRKSLAAEFTDIFSTESEAS
jgi:acyl-CoA synthetase (AMP-forming)/AMP-acid ligase II